MQAVVCTSGLLRHLCDVKFQLEYNVSVPVESENQDRSSIPGVLAPNQASSHAASASASSSLHHTAYEVSPKGQHQQNMIRCARHPGASCNSLQAPADWIRCTIRAETRDVRHRGEGVYAERMLM